MIKYLLYITLSIVFCWLPGLAEQAPGFSCDQLAGNRLKVDYDGTGKYILLHFWDTCCPGCREALPAVQFAQDEFKTMLHVVTISTDTPKTQSKIKSFLKMKGYTFDVGLDPNLEIRKLFGGTESPASFLISPNGEILFHRFGASPDEKEALADQIRSFTQSYQDSTSKEMENH